ncbi:MAG: GTP 3',8-cyclase MoaA [Euryarchaeota archaeon]|nr:GTP 3',8-cyclase MoaA [Euryarchaeota archaeon]
MKDPYGREITNLRVSVTQRCNLRCAYCHREGERSPGKEMTATEIGRLVSVGASLGMRKLKLTGGEPLLRNDIVEIVGRCRKLVDEVSMTTNGILLDELSGALREAGLRRVNVSLDTLDSNKYKAISGVDALEDAIDGTRRAVEAGLSPVKINMVVMKGINETEIEEMIGFSRDIGAVLQLIELEAPREKVNDAFYSEYHYPLDTIESAFASRAVRIVSRSLHRRMKFYLPEEVEVVRPMHNTTFCANCHRLRITSDGMLKPCLLTENGLVDVLSVARSGASDEELSDQFRRAIDAREPYWR